MIRVYCDTNIISQMKNGFANDLKNILLNENKFTIFYSQAHVNDVKYAYFDGKTDDSLLMSDFDFISTLTNNMCIYFGVNGSIRINKIHPNDFLKDDIEYSDFSSNLINNNILEHDIFKVVSDFISTIGATDLYHNKLNLPENTPSHLKKFLKSKNIRELFKNFDAMEYGWYHQTLYGIDREFIRNGFSINRDASFNHSNPFEISNKLPIYTEEDQNFKITNELIKLDLVGYQEDKIKVDSKKKMTFKNILNDAHHAEFAKICHFFITDDKKLYKKVDKIYKHTNVATFIVNAQDFIQFYNSKIYMEKLNTNLLVLYQTLKYAKNSMAEQNKIYFLDFYIFDYFNSFIYRIEDNCAAIIFISYSNYATFSFEIEKIIEKIEKFFNKNAELIYKEKEIDFTKQFFKYGSWKKNNIEFNILLTSGKVQIYMYEF
ncbi:MAG: hypothetical protein ACK5LP_08460 [Campylobacteraceae bacterium]